MIPSNKKVINETDKNKIARRFLADSFKCNAKIYIREKILNKKTDTNKNL